MRIDSHQHFWRYDAAEYDWIDGSMGAIRRDFLPDDFAPVLAASGFSGSIAVQARQTLAETEWLLDLARQHRFIGGVVGWVPLADPQVADLLDRLVQQQAFKGVRHVLQAEPDPHFLEQADFNAGLAAVADRSLTYDLLIHRGQLPAAAALADRHPNLSLVLDHIAKPVVDGRPDPAWAQAIRDLARREHVHCKLSGMITEVPGRRWTPDAVRPYFEIVLAAFGPRRLMFGSDWPVCLVAGNHQEWSSCVRLLITGLTADEQAAILGGTAARFYRIGTS